MAPSPGRLRSRVTVDMTTWETRVDDFGGRAGSGQVIHPCWRGQIEGGVAQGIGYALYENVVWKDGRLITTR